MGDFLFNDYQEHYRNLTSRAIGPVAGQLNPLASVMSLMKQGEFDRARDVSGKLLRDNIPYINLFYLRPVLDYFIFWNLNEMMAPGSLRRTEEAMRERNHQDYFLAPSETVR
jgi:hypothetical protein